MTRRTDSLWLGLLAAASLAVGCGGQTDPCVGVSKSVACVTISVQGYTGQIDGATFIFSGAEQATIAFGGAGQVLVPLTDTSGHKVTKLPFTAGFALPNLAAAGSGGGDTDAGDAAGDVTDASVAGGTNTQVQCLADFKDAVVAFGTASVTLTPGVHTKVTMTLAAAKADMDFGDLAITGGAGDASTTDSATQ